MEKKILNLWTLSLKMLCNVNLEGSRGFTVSSNNLSITIIKVDFFNRINNEIIGFIFIIIILHLSHKQRIIIIKIYIYKLS